MTELLHTLQTNKDLNNYYTIKGTKDNQLYLAVRAIKAYESIIQSLIAKYDEALAYQILQMVRESNIIK